MSPPRLTRKLVALLLAADDREFVLADMDERFRIVVAEKGLGAGRRWYRRQLLRAAPSLLGERLGDLMGLFPGVRGAGLLHAYRGLVRSPLFTFGFVATLAIGLASAATVTSVAWHIWLAPLPFPDSGKVVRVYELGRASVDGRARTRISPPLLEDLRAADLDPLEGVTGLAEYTLDWSRTELDSAPRQLYALKISRDFFSILGIPAHQGRLFMDASDEVVLARSFWEDIGGDPALIGGPIVLEGETYRVVGVADLPLPYRSRADVMLPLRFEESDLAEGMRGARYLEVIARVAPSATVAQASQAVDRFVADLGAQHAMHEGAGGVVVPLREDITAPFRGVLALLLAAGIAFFSLATVNLSGLVAARRVAALPDLSVRRALGASRGRLLVDALLEGSMLGAVGGIVGLVATAWALPTLVHLLPDHLPRIEAVGLSLSLAAALVGVGVVGGGLIGLVGHFLTPSQQGLESRRGMTERLGMRRGLVVAQIALTTVLATAGAGVLRNALALRAVELGFVPEGVTVAYVGPSSDRYASDDALNGFWSSLLAGIEGRGIAAAVATNIPLTGSNMRFGFLPEGSEEQDWAQYHTVSSDYFTVLGIRVVEGRPFDDAEPAPSVIVSRALADKHFPGRSALGSQVQVVGEARTVVGVVESTRHFGPGQDAPLELYVPLGQDPWAFAQVVLQAPLEESGVIASVLSEIDPGLEPSSPMAFTNYVREWFASVVAQLVIVGLLAAVGAALATLGLYTIVAYYVSRRQREIGIRMALGAPADTLFRSVMAQGTRMAGWGVVLGSVAWLWARGPAAAWTGVERIGDPVVLGAVGVAVIGISILAVMIPAFRSTRVDPTVSLAVEN